MRHRSTKKILGRKSAQRASLLKGLANSLIEHGRLTTTLPKAKVTQSFVERLVTRSRTSSLHVRRYLMSVLGNERSVKKLLTDLGPKYATRHGGYTRIIKLGRRAGDAGVTALIEFV